MNCTFLTITVDDNDVGGALLCNAHVVAIGCMHDSCGGLEGPEESFIIEERCGASAIHNDEAIVAVSEERVVGWRRVRHSLARCAAVCEGSGLIRHHHAGELSHARSVRPATCTGGRGRG